MMLQACTRRKLEDEWDGELATKPKLALLKLLKEKGGESRCLDVADKDRRRMMMMIRGGTAPLRIEWGRWRGLKRSLLCLGASIPTSSISMMHPNIYRNDVYS